MTTIVNYGAGKNSTAMIIAMWLKNEPIDAIVFADTGNEKAETYAFIEVFDSWLKSVGLPAVTRVQYALKQRRSRVVMYPAIKSAGSLLAWEYHNVASAIADGIQQNYVYQNLGEEVATSHLFPAIAYGRGACAAKWKLEPISKWRNSIFLEKGITCIGYHYGEKRRLYDKKGNLRPPLDEDGWARRYPLIEWKIDEADCQALCQNYLGITPPKSACWFCPSSRPYEVAQLPPDLYELGCDIEELAEYQGKAKGITNPMTALGRNFKWRELHQLPPYRLAEPPKPCSCMDAGYEQLELFPDL